MPQYFQVDEGQKWAKRLVLDRHQPKITGINLPSVGAPVGAPKGPQEPLWERPWEPLWEPLWAHVGAPQEPPRAHVEGQVNEGPLPPSRNTLF